MTQIVVNHLTRMAGDHICVAGIDRETDTHVRPTTDASQPLTRKLLSEEGGPFALGAVVDLGETVPEPSPPEIEDQRFTRQAAKQIDVLDGDAYIELLDQVCVDSVEAAFGPELERLNWKYAFEKGRGAHSLACVRAQASPDLEINQFGGLTLRFNDPDKPAYIACTDLRFFEADQQTVRDDAVQDCARRMREQVPVRLMLGVARAWKKPDDDRERHWLQINGVCLEDRPLGSDP